MSTGQAPIKFKSGNALDTSDVVSNVATNLADIENASNVDGLDIYPRTVTTEHLFAADGSFSGYLRAGAVFVGSGGVTISSEADGDTPATGLYLDSSKLILYKSSAATVTLDGTTGDATFTGTITAGGTFTGSMTTGTLYVGSGGVVISSEAAGATPTTGVIITSSAIKLYKSSAVVIELDGSDGSFTIQTAASGARLVIDSGGIEAYDSGGTKTVDIGSDGSFTLAQTLGWTEGPSMVIDTDGFSIENATGTTVYIGMTYKGLELRSTHGVSRYPRGITFSGDATGYLGLVNGTLAYSHYELSTTGHDFYVESTDKQLILKGVGSLGGADVKVDGTFSATSISGDHQTAGGSAIADGTITFYAASSSGGAVKVLNTITFSDGLITSWTQA